MSNEQYDSDAEQIITRFTADIGATFAELVSVFRGRGKEFEEFREQCRRAFMQFVGQRFQGHTSKARSRKAERRMRRKWYR